MYCFFQGCFGGSTGGRPASPQFPNWRPPTTTSPPPPTTEPEYPSDDDSDDCSDDWENSVEFPRGIGCGSGGQRPSATPVVPPRFPGGYNPPSGYPRPTYQPPVDSQPTQEFYCNGNTMQCEWVPGSASFPYRSVLEL